MRLFKWLTSGRPPETLSKRTEQTRLTSAINAAEADLNTRVYRLFDLTPDEIRLLQQEVAH